MKFDSVLVIDDNEADRYVLARLLRKSNMAGAIHEETDGLAGLDFLKRSSVSLVFLDINMPRMNGFEFLDAFAQLREQQPELKDVQLTMFTSSSDIQDLERIAQYDFVAGHIVKMPRSAADLRAELERQLPA